MSFTFELVLLTNIDDTQRVKIWKKFYVIYSFFFLRKIIIHFFTFFFYCVILPTSVFLPEVKIPNWATIYVPSIVTLLSAIATPRLVLFLTTTTYFFFSVQPPHLFTLSMTLITFYTINYLYMPTDHSTS